MGEREGREPEVVGDGGGMETEIRDCQYEGGTSERRERHCMNMRELTVRRYTVCEVEKESEGRKG